MFTFFGLSRIIFLKLHHKLLCAHIYHSLCVRHHFGSLGLSSCRFGSDSLLGRLAGSPRVAQCYFWLPIGILLSAQAAHAIFGCLFAFCCPPRPPMIYLYAYLHFVVRPWYIWSIVSTRATRHSCSSLCLFAFCCPPMIHLVDCIHTRNAPFL